MKERELVWKDSVGSSAKPARRMHAYHLYEGRIRQCAALTLLVTAVKLAPIPIGFT
ncbi:hypothetical protein CBM2586_B90289 [Cupriavidus phytorum]|uniref:Uncharacterized protein n=1 Tax=Cupriavidus taiwanensis TaxID=164546 RepID=A0A976FSN3_9BURK|nr:hypothetical protein CBM2586_B90289 [Cupriavidus taiwanensis]